MATITGLDPGDYSGGGSTTIVPEEKQTAPAATTGPQESSPDPVPLDEPTTPTYGSGAVAGARAAATATASAGTAAAEIDEGEDFPVDPPVPQSTTYLQSLWHRYHSGEKLTEAEMAELTPFFNERTLPETPLSCQPAKVQQDVKHAIARTGANAEQRALIEKYLDGRGLTAEELAAIQPYLHKMNGGVIPEHTPWNGPQAGPMPPGSVPYVDPAEQNRQDWAAVMKWADAVEAIPVAGNYLTAVPRALDLTYQVVREIKGEGADPKQMADDLAALASLWPGSKVTTVAETYSRIDDFLKTTQVGQKILNGTASESDYLDFALAFIKTLHPKSKTTEK